MRGLNFGDKFSQENCITGNTEIFIVVGIDWDDSYVILEHKERNTHTKVSLRDLKHCYIAMSKTGSLVNNHKGVHPSKNR